LLHGLKIEFVSFFDLIFDEVVETVGSACGYLMDAGSVFVVVGGKFVIGHCEIAFLGIENCDFLFQRYLFKEVILVRIAVFDERTHFWNFSARNATHRSISVTAIWVNKYCIDRGV